MLATEGRANHRSMLDWRPELLAKEMELTFARPNRFCTHDAAIATWRDATLSTGSQP